jgi:CPA1 family monovalent cation:H+ antiporter
MQILQFLLFLLLCSVLLGWTARRARVPYPIALVIGGAALGFVPGTPQADVDPQFLLVLVLPPILYQAALLTPWRDFKANLRPIGLLAFGLVIATTLAVGAVLKLLIPDIPWAAAFVFGAIVSPPDAVAATAILSRLNIPRHIVVVLEGESLVNDAAGLVLYKFAVAAVLTGAFSLPTAAWQFALVSIGGVLIGLVIAWVFLKLHRFLGDAFIEVLVSLSVPYTIYIVAESMHLSGVLAVVAAGIYRSRHTPVVVSAEMRILARSVWNILVFFLNSLVFILIGLQLNGILERVAHQTAGELVLYGVLLGLAAIAVRFLWVYPVAYVPHFRGRDSEAPPPGKEIFVLGWCGMRGIVSLAAALALPVAVDTGAPFPYRDHIVFFTFVVILVTLVAQGLTLSPIIRRLGLGTDWSGIEEERQARADLGRAALAEIDRVGAEQGAPRALAERIRAEFSEKILEAMPAPEQQSEAEMAKRLRNAAVRAERQELIRIWRLNRVSDEILHQLEEELDYQEARF